ncbi:hypothetical protein WJR50_16055 [Catalinimonas sp. 4WD22]|uniref:hypothetical protein n=1 Tax=Catalinimonas locisalis TaxID=3133978 RepID=UPI0031014C87
MMTQTELYQSVLKKLSKVPAMDLAQVDKFLSQWSDEPENKSKHKDKIMAFAGAWEDMKEEDFQDYLKNAKESGNESFGREVEL